MQARLGQDYHRGTFARRWPVGSLSVLAIDGDTKAPASFCRLYKRGRRPPFASAKSLALGLADYNDAGTAVAVKVSTLDELHRRVPSANAACLVWGGRDREARSPRRPHDGAELPLPLKLQSYVTCHKLGSSGAHAWASPDDEKFGTTKMLCGAFGLSLTDYAAPL